MMLQAENENNKYVLKRERQKKNLWKKNLDYISDLFEYEYFKVKKMEIIEKMTCNQANGHNNDNFNKYDGENYGVDILLY